jgi:DNA-directed RNA polymerase sigma subunit (sigma70/sigma32)
MTANNTRQTTARHDVNVTLKQEITELSDRLDEAREAGLDRLVSRLERKLERAKNDFAQANWGLAVQTARKFFPHGNAGHQNSDDYIAASLLGLWEAFTRWDPSKGSFSHFCQQHLKGAVGRAVCAYETQTSYGDFTARPAVKAAKTKLASELGRAPSDAEIAAECGETVDLVSRVLAPAPVSIDTPAGAEGGTLGDTLIGDDFIPGFGIGEADPGVVDGNVDELVGAAALSATELWVIARHLGLDGAEPESLVRIGAVIDKGRQTVQRHSARAEQALAFVAG